MEIKLPQNKMMVPAQRRLKSSVAVSVAGMVAPFVLGGGLGWILFHYTDLFPTKTSLMEAMLFLGASMCSLRARGGLYRFALEKQLTRQQHYM